MTMLAEAEPQGRVAAQTYDGGIRAVREQLIAELDRGDQALEWWLPTLRQYLYPPTAGRTSCFLARSGHMKTTTLMAGVRSWGQRLAETNAARREMNVILFAWAEQSNDQAAWELMRDKAFTWKEVRDKQISRRQIIDLCDRQQRLPVILLGYADGDARYGSVPLARQRGGVMSRINANALATEHIAATCEQINAGDFLADANGKAQVTAVFADYLQKFRPEERAKNRAEEIAQTATEFNRIAQAFRVPLIYTANANLKQIDDGEIPGDSEVFGSSEAVMEAYDIIAGMRPIKKYGIEMPIISGNTVTGETVKVGNRYYVATHNLVVWRINKARKSFDAEGVEFPLWFDRDGNASETNPYGGKPDL